MSLAMATPRICVVDDEPGVRELLRLVCEAIALDVATYDSAESYLAGGEPANWDLMVLDIDMPGMSGLELLETLRRRGLSQPVVMISGEQDAARQARADALGAASFFAKPFNVAELSHRIGELLEPAHAPAPPGPVGNTGPSQGLR